MSNLERARFTQPTLQSSRPQELIGFVKEEVNKFRSGELNRISTNEELRARFSYATTASFYPLLQKKGLIAQRRSLMKETGGERLTASREAAWMLGILSGAGSILVDEGKIALNTQNAHLLNTFKANTEALLSVEVRINPSAIHGKKSQEARFSNRRVSRMLGNFRKEDWPETIREKHRWVFEDEQFTWGFLEGYSEVKGQIDKKRVDFSIKHENVVEILHEAMLKVGLRSAELKSDDQQEIKGIFIRDPNDRKKFAENIHLHNPAKEQVLDWYRNTNEASLNISRHKLKSGSRKKTKEKTSAGSMYHKRDSLIFYVRDEIERYKAGEITTLSSSEELRSRFGYSDRSTVSHHIKQAGLSEERKVALIRNITKTEKRPKRAQPKKEKLSNREGVLILPSIEWAWMMGILAGGGHVSQSGAISFMNPDEKLRTIFKSRGERLFEKNANTPPIRGKEKSPTILFNTVRYARALGNFSFDSWVDTIVKHHNWILENNRYVWQFLEGFFETKGHFYKNFRKKYRNIELQTVHRSAGNFLAELMVRVGIENPKPHKNKYAREGIDGIEISSLKDVKHFAENVHSVVPKKEELLAFYRGLSIEGVKKKITQEDKISEWQRMSVILGHSPSKREIAVLKHLKLTKFSPAVYAKFGIVSGKADFRAARENMERVIQAKDVSIDFREEELQNVRDLYCAERVKKEQLRHSARVYTDEDIIQEWFGIRRKLGHVPNSFELQHLKKENKTKCSYRVYIHHFGDRRSFANAQQALEKIAHERGEPELSTKTKVNFASSPPKNRILQEDAIQEWRRMTEVLRHAPYSREIRELKKQKKTKYSPQVYINKFGIIDNGKKSFITARNELARVLSDRGMEPQVDYLPSQRGRKRKFSDEEIILEWKRIKVILGHSPKKHEIQRIHDGEKTRISQGVYSYRFGGRSWVRARENLERIIQEQKESRKIQRGEDGPAQQVQVFPPPEDEAK